LPDFPLLDFLSIFSINSEIPDYLGLGKSVSRGFGTVVRIESQKQSRKGVKPGAFFDRITGFTGFPYLYFYFPLRGQFCTTTLQDLVFLTNFFQVASFFSVLNEERRS